MSRVLTAVVLSVLALVVATPAQAKTVKADLTVRLATVSTKGTPPAPGSSQVDAGTIAGRGPLNGGAVITKVTYGKNLTFAGTTRSFYKLGTIAGTLKGTVKANPDGSVSLSGSGKSTGGTGAYRRAKGTLTFTGTIAKGSQVAVLKTKGSVTY